VINGIMQSKRSSEVKFGIIPEGGGNDFARNFKLSNDVEKAVEVLVQEETAPVDVGKIENLYFINALGLGFDAQVAEYARKIKYLNGLPRYFVALIKALVKLKPHFINLVINNEFFDISAILISIGNGLSTGGGFLLTPHAKVDDGKFDVCILHEVKLGTLLKVLPTVFSGNHIKHKKVEIIRSDVVNIKTDRVLPIYFDGELPVLKNPFDFKIELIHRAINFICDPKLVP
jgi:diacylglycerol kinase (ATP)